ncbi:hypothetical protein E3Q19_01607 [Wallemia mellicola]|nr:hypothetical protein E3Q19_01607 [Wallemia mellicola]
MLTRKSHHAFCGLITVRTSTLIYSTTTFLTYAASAYAAFNLLTLSCPHCTTSPSNSHQPSNILDSADAQARFGARILIVSIWYAITMVVGSSFGIWGVVKENIRNLKLFRLMHAIDVILSFLVTFVVGPVGLTSSMKDFVCDSPTRLESNNCWEIWKSSVCYELWYLNVTKAGKRSIYLHLHTFILGNQRKLRPRPSIVLVPPPPSSNTRQLTGYIVASPTTTKHKKSHSIRQASVDVSNGGPIALAIRPDEGLLPHERSYSDEVEL